MVSLKTLFQSAAHLFYPHICTGCGTDLLSEDEPLCFHCIYKLPHTHFEKYPNNPVEKIFFGRIKTTAANAGFYFTKGELMQIMLHDFKYNGNKEIGIYLSKIMAEKMMASGRFKNIDFLIPLPLHAEKEYKRGFNQAKIICGGIAEVMNIPVLGKNVIRTHFTETQTKKQRTERWQNVAESFKVLYPEQLLNKHVLLVDDVITTGATLEACAQQLINIDGIKISITTLTTASK